MKHKTYNALKQANYRKKQAEQAQVEAEAINKQLTHDEAVLRLSIGIGAGLFVWGLVYLKHIVGVF
jgi:hypothetical protein